MPPITPSLGSGFAVACVLLLSASWNGAGFDTAATTRSYGTSALAASLCVPFQLVSPKPVTAIRRVPELVIGSASRERKPVPASSSLATAGGVVPVNTPSTVSFFSPAAVSKSAASRSCPEASENA